MKEKLISFSVCAVLILLALGSASGQTDARVKKIRTQVRLINLSLSKMSKTKKDLSGISAEGAAATYYSSGGKLRKIRAEVFGESGKSMTTLYYQEGKLIFAFEKSSEYQVPIGATGKSGIANTREERAYFNNGKLIRVIINENITKPNARWEMARKNLLEWDQLIRNANPERK